MYKLKPFFLIIILFHFGISFGQTTNEDLSKIQSIAQAEMFIKKNQKVNGKIFTINSSIDTSMVVLPLYSKKNGFTFNISNHYYKVLAIDSVLSFRVNYIYLDGKQLSKDRIDVLRQEIVSKYKNGTSFQDLVQQYNMDSNTTGDTWWFAENVMVNEFETAVKKHKKGDIFTVDTPKESWYHVVLKTYDDSYIKELTVLTITNSNEK